MLQVAGLVLPLFSLILLGWLVARWRPLPLAGLAWLNVFILYLALPALFFRLLARTPVAEFANGAFLLRTTLATFLVFAACFAIARLARRGDTRVATIQGFAGAYGNIGYMGPPLAIAAFGPEAGVPVALVFCLDNSMHFTLAPLLMALGARGEDGAPRESIPALLGGIVRKIVTHPFILSTIAGIVAAVLRWAPPGPLDALLVMLSNAAAPVRAVRDGRDGGAPAAPARAARALLARPDQARRAPARRLPAARPAARARAPVAARGGAARRAPVGDQRVRPRPAVRRLGGARVERRRAVDAGLDRDGDELPVPRRDGRTVTLARPIR